MLCLINLITLSSLDFAQASTRNTQKERWCRRGSRNFPRFIQRLACLSIEVSTWHCAIHGTSISLSLCD